MKNVSVCAALCPDFKEAWRAKTVDGLTPYQMAVTAGKQVALRAVLKDALPFALSQQEPTFSEEYDSDQVSTRTSNFISIVKR